MFNDLHVHCTEDVDGGAILKDMDAAGMEHAVVLSPHFLSSVSPLHLFPVSVFQPFF